MALHTITRTLLGLALLGLLAGTTARVAPATAAATAAPSVPSLLATPDDAAYGVLIVYGRDFTPNSTATLQLRDAASGTVLLSLAVSAGSGGTFSKLVSFHPSCAIMAAGQVTLRAIDASQAVSADLVVALGTPQGLAQTQLAAAQAALSTLQTTPPKPYNSTTQLAWEQRIVAAQADVIADQARMIAGQAAQAAGTAC